MDDFQEVRVVFGIDSREARFEGFVDPSQPSEPYFRTVASAAEQLEALDPVTEVDPPAQTMARYVSTSLKGRDDTR